MLEILRAMANPRSAGFEFHIFAERFAVCVPASAAKRDRDSRSFAAAGITKAFFGEYESAGGCERVVVFPIADGIHPRFRKQYAARTV